MSEAIELNLSDFGLLTVQQVAESRGCHPRTVQRWIAAGLLPAVPIQGSGPHPVYLVPAKIERKFTPPPKTGRPRRGSQ